MHTHPILAVTSMSGRPLVYELLYLPMSSVYYKMSTIEICVFAYIMCCQVAADLQQTQLGAFSANEKQGWFATFFLFRVLLGGLSPKHQPCLTSEI